MSLSNTQASPTPQDAIGSSTSWSVYSWVAPALKQVSIYMGFAVNFETKNQNTSFLHLRIIHLVQPRDGILRAIFLHG